MIVNLDKLTYAGNLELVNQLKVNQIINSLKVISLIENLSLTYSKKKNLMLLLTLQLNHM